MCAATDKYGPFGALVRQSRVAQAEQHAHWAAQGREVALRPTRSVPYEQLFARDF